MTVGPPLVTSRARWTEFPTGAPVCDFGHLRNPEGGPHLRGEAGAFLLSLKSSEVTRSA